MFYKIISLLFHVLMYEEKNKRLDKTYSKINKVSKGTLKTYKEIERNLNENFGHVLNLL